jgi:glucosamine-6-phosphate deaminase
MPAVTPLALSDTAERFEKKIASAGGIDIQLLGIGANGHIGFNEPGSSLASRTRVKTLAASTRRDNGRFFEADEAVPAHCVTQGIGTILDARHLILIASGGEKARAVYLALEGPVSASHPASAVQLHPHVTVVLDEVAASDLHQREYYDFAWENKPTWQLKPSAITDVVRG